MSARTYDLNSFFRVAGNPISREGVFPYSGASIGAPDPDRVYQVLRPAEELGDPETLESFRLLPIIDDHTMLGSGFSPAEDVGVHGVIGDNVKFVDGVMTADLKIFSDSLAKKLQNGKTELSCGYRCVYDFTPGVWQGQAYDAVQRQIRGNHLALVDEGRMGPKVAVLDQMVFSVDAKEREPAMDDDIKEALAMIIARLEKLEKLELAENETQDPPAEIEIEADADPEAEAEADADPEAPVEDEEPPAMDAMLKQIRGLLSAVASRPVVDEAYFVQLSARKADLANRLSTHIGTFDHTGMTHADVVDYGLERMGLKAKTAGSKEHVLEGALQARATPVPHVATSDSRATALAASIATYSGA